MLTPVTAPVGELAVPAGETETAARLDPANYTPVLDAPFYPFENPWGNGGSWNIPGDEYGNVLQVDYKFGDEDRTGLVYLPEVVRNSYYTVCCLMNNTGKFTVEYMVADWNDGDSWNDLVFLHQPAPAQPGRRFDGACDGSGDLLQSRLRPGCR